MIQYSFLESFMGKSKHKCIQTMETQLSENSRADRKKSKKDVVHGMVVTYLESKTRRDVYRNL